MIIYSYGPYLIYSWLSWIQYLTSFNFRGLFGLNTSKKSIQIKVEHPLVKAWARQFSIMCPLDISKLQNTFGCYLDPAILRLTKGEIGHHPITTKLFYINSLFLCLTSPVLLAKWYGIQPESRRPAVPDPPKAKKLDIFTEEHDIICFLASILLWKIKNWVKIVDIFSVKYL